MVDSGGFLANDRTVHGNLRGDAIVKNEWVLEAYEKFRVEIANLSAGDLRALSSRNGKFGKAGEAPPLLGRLVSANIVAEPMQAITPKPFRLVELTDRHGTRVRIAFVGVTDVEGGPIPGFRLAEPMDATKRAVPEARNAADLVVVLAHMKVDEAVRLSRDVPGIDLLIAGAGELFVPPIRSGRTLIVFTPFETRMLGEVRFHRGSDGALVPKERFIALDEAIPDDPAAAEMVATQRNTYKAEIVTGSRLRQRPGPGDSYVGAQTCATCHSAQYIAWAGTAHARASNAVLAMRTEIDSSCLSCHATKPVDRAVEPLQNVQCEGCHGPGAQHSVKPGKGYGRIIDKGSSCVTCHTPETTAGFDLKSFWAKIRH